MMNNQHLYAKALEVHYQDLRNEAENRQLLAQLPRRLHMGRKAAGKLGLLLIKLGMWLKQLDHPQAVIED